MALHLIKLAVGCDSIEHLAGWQAERRKSLKAQGLKPELFHRTFQTPKRRAELLAGGSLYWVIKGVVQARQRITGFREGTKDDGSACCLVMLDKRLVAVRPVPRRAFQGWRYLAAADAPADLSGRRDALAAMPPEMRRALIELGLI